MAESRKILVVEDETALLNVLVEWLKIEGFAAFGVSNGQDALRAAKDKLPDLILLDIILPGKNGFEIMKELSALPLTAKIPIIILTNLGDSNERQLAMSLGAKGYLIKAENDFDSIRRAIQSVMNRNKNGRQQVLNKKG